VLGSLGEEELGPIPSACSDPKQGHENSGVHIYQFLQEPCRHTRESHSPPARHHMPVSQIGRGRPIRQEKNSGEMRSGDCYIRKAPGWG
jgi:hypothetical protein